MAAGSHNNATSRWASASLNVPRRYCASRVGALPRRDPGIASTFKPCTFKGPSLADGPGSFQLAATLLLASRLTGGWRHSPAGSHFARCAGTDLARGLLGQGT